MPDPTVVKPTPATPLQTLVEDYQARCCARGLAANSLSQAYCYPLQGISATGRIHVDTTAAAGPAIAVDHLKELDQLVLR